MKKNIFDFWTYTWSLFSHIGLADFIPRKFTVIWVDVGKITEWTALIGRNSHFYIFPTSSPDTWRDLRDMKSANTHKFLKV